MRKLIKYKIVTILFIILNNYNIKIVFKIFNKIKVYIDTKLD